MPFDPSHSLPQRVSRMYFRVFMPLIAVALAWGAWGEKTGTVILLLSISASLLIFTVLHFLLPQQYQERLKIGVGVWLIGLLIFLAFLSEEIGLVNDQAQLSALLLFVPLMITSFGLLYFEQPRLARGLSLYLTFSITLVLARWTSDTIPVPTSTVVMAFLGGLLATYFGDVTANLQRSADHARENSRRDALTGLLNRRAFDDRQSNLTPGTLAVLDIDHFKLVNDTYGHDAGDRVLRAVADVLLDQVGQSGEAYRWGGEEFVVFIPATSPLEPLRIMQEVRVEVAHRSFMGGTHVTLSAGLSKVNPGETLDNAFQRADQALRHAKQTGRDQIVQAEELQGV